MYSAVTQSTLVTQQMKYPWKGIKQTVAVLFDHSQKANKQLEAKYTTLTLQLHITTASVSSHFPIRVTAKQLLSIG